MLKKIFIILALLAAAYSAFYVVPVGVWWWQDIQNHSQKQSVIPSMPDTTKPQKKLRVEAVIFKTKDGPVIIQAEIADAKNAQTIGLMHRDTMADEEGMLFVYEQEQEMTMWMRNTILPLDMIFISKQGKISHIAYSAQPFSLDIISSNGLARAVLEVNAGIADKLKLKVGDKVNHAAFQ